MNKSNDSDLFFEYFKNSSKNLTILTRKNIGRDFGAYKCGVSYLSKIGALDGIMKLGFFNDSIYYLNNFDWFINLNNLNSDVSSLYVNYEKNPPHFQSMAFLCDHKVIMSKVFRNFWKNYYPTQIRVKVIKNGELELSKALVRAGFQFKSLANDVLSKGLKEFTPIENQSLTMFAFEAGPQQNLFRTVFNRTEANLDFADHFNFSSDSTNSLINLVLTSKNTSHAMGHYFSRNYGFPLKLDLVHQGSLGFFDITKLLTELKIDNDEVADVIFLIGQRGTFYSVSGWDKLFRHFGLT